jgi:predicted GTPase
MVCASLRGMVNSRGKILPDRLQIFAASGPGARTWRLPQVIIIGRPNVGKSTLFNRLVGKKLALVDDQPGVTRDRRFGEAHLLGLDFTIVDTAGWEDEDAASLPGRMRARPKRR